MNLENLAEFFYSHTSKRMSFKKAAIGCTNHKIAGYLLFKKIKSEGYIDYTGLGEDEPPKYKNVRIKPANTKILDPIMISRMLNNQKNPITNKRSSPNPFLIIPSYVPTLVKNLAFSCSNDLFWGEEWEISVFSGELFNLIINELMNHPEYAKLIDMILLDYVPYSKQVAFKNLIWNRLVQEGYPWEHLKNIQNQIGEATDLFGDNLLNQNLIVFLDTLYPILKTYGITNENEDEEQSDLLDKKILYDFYLLDGNIKYFEREAIGRLYLSVKYQFDELYKSFCYEQSDFKKLPKKIELFIEEKFLVLLKELLGSDSEGELTVSEYKEVSLGYRVQNIVSTDIAQLSELFENITPTDFEEKNKNGLQQSFIELLESSKNYINNLQHTQFCLDRAMFSCDSGQDAELLYSKAIQSDWEEQYKCRCEELLKRHSPLLQRIRKIDNSEKLKINKYQINSIKRGINSYS